jgi:prefoldin subunit 5
MNIIEQVIEYLDDNKIHLDNAIKDDKKAENIWAKIEDLKSDLEELTEKKG